METGKASQTAASEKTLKDKLRVAIIVTELRAGGMERVVVHLAREFSRREIPAMVVCMQKPGDLSPFLADTGVRLEALDSSRGWDLAGLWRLIKLLRNFRPTVINVHDYASSPYAVVANLLSVAKPVVFTAHGLLYEGFDSLRPRYRFFSKGFSCISAVSAKVAARHRQFLGWQRAVAVIPNGVPAIEKNEKKRKRHRSLLRCEPQSILFLAVGNPRPEKGFEDLIDAAGILAQSDLGKGFAIAIVGKLQDNDYCRDLLRRVEEKGLDNVVRFLGYRDDVADLYSAADVFVLSSRSEGLPLVILEAMTAGLPIVATRVGGVPDAVGEYGLIASPSDPEDLANAMYKMASDRKMAGSLGEGAGRYARAKYGVESMADNYVSFFMSLRDAGSGL